MDDKYIITTKCIRKDQLRPAAAWSYMKTRGKA
jgi:hypothetical protein